MSQLGINPYGAGGPFGGPGLISILGVIPIAANEIIVTFDVEPTADDPFAFNSATNVENWTLSTVDPFIPSTDPSQSPYLPKGSSAVPTIEPLLARAESDLNDPNQIHIFTDTRMETRVLYDLELQPSVRGLSCEAQSGPTVHRFGALRPAPPRRARFVQEDKFRDWDSVFLPRDGIPAGTWRIEDNGDIAGQEAEASLRKRIFRRILASPGDFAHIPGYGVGVLVKRLAKITDVQELANRVALQAKEEPDVLRAACVGEIIQQIDGTVVSLQVIVQRTEAKDSKFLFEFPIS